MYKRSLIGRKVLNFTVLELSDRTTARGKKMYLCECDCGEKFLAVEVRIRNLTISSCGCDEGKEPPHHLTGDRLHTTWRGMIQRCYNPNASMYHRYGGRGITVCDRWRYSFRNFA